MLYLPPQQLPAAPSLSVCPFVTLLPQLLLGFLRPAATARAEFRKAWDIVHSTVGRTALFIGIFNVFFGITIYSLM